MNLKIKFLSKDNEEISKQLNRDELPVDFVPLAAVFIYCYDSETHYIGILYIGYLSNFIPYTVIKPNFGNLYRQEHDVHPILQRVQTMVLDMVG